MAIHVSLTFRSSRTAVLTNGSVTSATRATGLQLRPFGGNRDSDH